MKRYRVPGRWFVPFEVTGAETLEQFVSQQVMPRMQEFVQLGLHQLQDAIRAWGYWLEQPDGSGNVHIRDLAGTAKALFTGDEPFLLKWRLLAVLQAETFQERPEGERYSLGLMLVQGDVG